MPADPLTAEEIEHGVETACYSGGPGEPYYQPWMQCMCGFVTERQPSWEDVGRVMDEHLAETLANGFRKLLPKKKPTRKARR